MGYDDADVVGIDLPQAVCWERLKYDIISSIDIPCRIEVAGRRLPAPIVRARLRAVNSDQLAYLHEAQMYLHRGMNLGVFGPPFRLYCRADGPGRTLLHLQADSDAAFPSKALTRLLSWSYGLQWRLIRKMGNETAEETRAALDRIRVHFDDVLAYDFGQLTEKGLSAGFHQRGYAYLAEHLRQSLTKV